MLDWAREEAAGAALTLSLRLPADAVAEASARGVPESVTNHFRARAAAAAREQRALFREGRIALLVGLVTLAVCLGASQLLTPLIPSQAIARLAEESLVILGWVANWRPIEIHLYDWWPIRRRRRLLERLAAAEVRLVPDAPA